MTSPRGYWDEFENRWIPPEEYSGIPEEFRGKTLADVVPRPDLAGFSSVVAATKRYIEGIQEAVPKGVGINYCGTVGGGKTLFGSIIAVEAVKALGCGKVLQVDAHTLFNSLKPSSANSPREKHIGYGFGTTRKEVPISQRLCSVDLLLIDDLGSEYHTDWAQVELDNIITSRHNNRKATIITTNLLNAEEFENVYGARIADRLLERNQWFTLDGPSYRKPFEG